MSEIDELAKKKTHKEEEEGETIASNIKKCTNLSITEKKTHKNRAPN